MDTTKREVVLNVAAHPESRDAWMHWAEYSEEQHHTTLSLGILSMAKKFPATEKYPDEYLNRFSKDLYERDISNALSGATNTKVEYPYKPIKIDLNDIETYLAPMLWFHKPETMKRTKHLKNMANKPRPSSYLSAARWENKMGNTNYAYALAWHSFNGLYGFRDESMSQEDWDKEITKAERCSSRLWRKLFLQIMEETERDGRFY